MLTSPFLAHRKAPGTQQTIHKYWLKGERCKAESLLCTTPHSLGLHCCGQRGSSDIPENIKNLSWHTSGGKEVALGLEVAASFVVQRRSAPGLGWWKGSELDAGTWRVGQSYAEAKHTVGDLSFDPEKLRTPDVDMCILEVFSVKYPLKLFYWMGI